MIIIFSEHKSQIEKINSIFSIYRDLSQYFYLLHFFSMTHCFYFECLRFINMNFIPYKKKKNSPAKPSLKIKTPLMDSLDKVLFVK